MPSGTGSLVNPLPSCTARVAVRFCGAGCCCAGITDDLTDCQAAESDASWPAGRCEDGMAMTRSVAMLAAIATAIEKRMTCWNIARLPDRSRSTDGASTGAMSLASFIACATALAARRQPAPSARAAHSIPDRSDRDILRALHHSY